MCLPISGWMPGYLLPDPGRIAGSFSLYLFGQAGSAPYAGRFSIDAAASLARVSMGFAAAVLLGVPLGVLSGRSPTVQSLLGTTIDGVRAVPGISWLPLSMAINYLLDGGVFVALHTADPGANGSASEVDAS